MRGTHVKHLLWLSIDYLVGSLIPFYGNFLKEVLEKWLFVITLKIRYNTHNFHHNYPSQSLCLQCFDAVGWAAGRASGL